MNQLLLLVLTACATDGARDTSASDGRTGTATEPSTTPPDVTPTSPDPDPDPAPLALCINEVMADNASAWLDDDGQASDWIELHNPTNADVDLDGWYLSDDPSDPFEQALPAGVIVPAGGYVVFAADGAAFPTGLHLGFSLSDEGDEVALHRQDGAGESLSFGLQAPDVSVARSPDCCADPSTCLVASTTSSPGASNADGGVVSETLIAKNSTWAYRADGTAPPADWTSPTFDDTGWATGVGYLGFGDNHIDTLLGWGTDPANRYVAYQFRQSFEVTEREAVLRLYVDLARDDGAVVYLNGEELLRSNLPPGVVDETTLASAAVEFASEFAYEHVLVPLDDLVEGTNVVAVEVHQVTAASADLTFDLSLVADQAVGGS